VVTGLILDDLRTPANAGGQSMKFIVPPQKDDDQDRICALNHTLCWLCSEDPRACEVA
jgi:hypothetical protein